VEFNRHELSTIKEVEITLKDMLSHLTNRVDNGVAVTGQENKTTLSKHSLILNDIKHEQQVQDVKFSLEIEKMGDNIKTIGGTTRRIYYSILMIILSGFVTALLSIGWKIVGRNLGLQ